MNMYVGITDVNWYESLKDKKFKEICFIKPAGNINFRALKRDELFLFKLHSPQNFIVGGGYFLCYSNVPSFMLWDIFNDRTGALNEQELNERLKGSSGEENRDFSELNTGCIVLADPFFFKEEQWIPIPEDWNSNIGHGKVYNIYKGIGRELYAKLQQNLSEEALPKEQEHTGVFVASGPQHALGEGAFQLMVMEAYKRSCAITGYRVLPALETAYIKPLSKGGTKTLDNGILLRRDLRPLFDLGYITISEDYTILISSKLKEHFASGSAYLKYHEKSLKAMPERFFELPNKENLKWHRENVFIK